MHPQDLALRDANLTGSYTLAAMAGRLRREAPWTTEAGGQGVADDHLVGQALAYARQCRAASNCSRHSGDMPPRAESLIADTAIFDCGKAMAAKLKEIVHFDYEQKENVAHDGLT